MRHGSPATFDSCLSLSSTSSFWLPLPLFALTSGIPPALSLSSSLTLSLLLPVLCSGICTPEPTVKVHMCMHVCKYWNIPFNLSMTRLEACEFGLRECRCPQLCPRAGVKLAPQQHQEDWQPMHYPGSLQNNQVKIHDRTEHGWMKYTVPGYTSWCLTVGPSGTCQVAQSLHPWALPE